MWIGSYHNCSGNLTCYNPILKIADSTNCRRFFQQSPVSSEYYMDNIKSLNVDAGGRIFAGDENGNLLIFQHNGNPLGGDTAVSVLLFERNLITIFDMASMSNGLTWIATGKGLYKYDAKTGLLSVDENIPKSVTCVEAEDSTYLWLGTSMEGIIRYSWSDSTRMTLDENQGLISNTIKDMSIDTKYGNLWIVSAEGLSKYDLAYTKTAVVENNAVVAYPNPFSFSNSSHAEIVIRNLVAESQVSIFDVRGKLIKTLDPVTRHSSGWVFQWVPDRHTVPGTYFCAARAGKGSAVCKILILP
jgi:ligand-binding sensor domain-containing protein